MKALELIIFPPLERPRYGYGISPYREQWKRERAIILSKRFTDAELAAEFWKAKERCMFVGAFSGMSIRSDSPLAQQAEALYRFATLPHYDEALP